MDLGFRLQAVRKRRGLTQRQLAEYSGVSLSLIRKIEQGERDDTRMDTLRRFAVALGCPVTVLLGPGPYPAPSSENGGGELWTPTRDALTSILDATATEPVAVGGLEAALSHATKLYHDNEYERLARILPRLITNARSQAHAIEPRAPSRDKQLPLPLTPAAKPRDRKELAQLQHIADNLQRGQDLEAAQRALRDAITAQAREIAEARRTGRILDTGQLRRTHTELAASLEAVSDLGRQQTRDMLTAIGRTPDEIAVLAPDLDRNRDLGRADMTAGLDGINMDVREREWQTNSTSTTSKPKPLAVNLFAKPGNNV